MAKAWLLTRATAPAPDVLVDEDVADMLDVTLVPA
jgi:hypothetical protein